MPLAVGEFEPAVFLFCGNASLPGKPYCACHAAIAFEAQAQRRQRAALFAATRKNATAKSAARRWNEYIGEASPKGRLAELAHMP